MPASRRGSVSLRSERLEDYYTVEKILGKGQYGIVKLCTNKATGEQYAAKHMRKRKGRMGVPIGDIKREMDIMNKLTYGRHLMGLHDAFETQTEIVLILDLLSGGELFDHLATMDCLTEGETVAFTVQVLEALRIMHSSQIVHLDLKPENLMLKDKHKKELVLIDFGLARELDGSGLRLMLGTAEFIAPEVVSFDEITTATDMWSLGVLIYIMLSGYSPFLGDDQADTYANISAGEYDLDDEYFGDVSEEAKDFISKLLILNPKKRMTLDECFSHPWLNPTSKTQVRRLDSKRLKAFNARRKLKAGINAVRGSVKFRLSLERISIGKRQCSLTSSSPSPPVKEEDDVFKTE